jgi:pentose-5-phosphate-3-epimerase
MISLPIETTGENLIQDISYIRDVLELKVGVWAWQGCPVIFFEQYIPFVDIIEYESRAMFWKSTKGGKTPHLIDPIVVESVKRLHDMLIDAGREAEVDLMEDGGLNAENVEQFVKVGMTVGEFSSPFLKGPEGTGPDNRYEAGKGQITAAVKKIQKVLDEAAAKYRSDDGLLKI